LSKTAKILERTYGTGERARRETEPYQHVGKKNKRRIWARKKSECREGGQKKTKVNKGTPTFQVKETKEETPEERSVLVK